LNSQPALNTFAALPWDVRKAVRAQIQADLKDGKVPASVLVPLKDVTSHLPMKMTGFSDFYTSLEHCQNCSSEMSSAAIAKNWWYAPSVYNSRVSSVLPTPHDIPRPKNVYFSAGVDSQPAYGPSRKVDFELEMVRLHTT
jgi:fumarylacetoacetase